ncbi:MAG TPA: glutamate--tRNA ligase [Candidatus Paceibacterota bacterium]|jgi:glutamyl-tRNA synthetase|nr:glutamate--tRNA ligase [Parcubacteria group bacterium]MDP6119698.1 glutamate--tRNA ligase [Candidatus Paceibacterota bacterium]HJN62796.1 glutamate--tRNA ligase [Candidatus Paceibacterota bacterium]|tara:strand:- start:9622 stop:10938 length:1317 start_codon:yes stop_codon:yes gene_type:complete
MAMTKVITRFPPSPTGYFHIGSARTALFNYLFAKNNNGEMILRFEDTDKERSKPEYEKDILEGLNWLGIKHDNDSVPKQSERLGVYRKHLQELINKDIAYISKEKEGKRDEVIRFRNPNTKIKFNDLIREEVEFDTTDLGDFIIAKSLDEPVYHLTVVVDDYETDITHVIRGEDHISNTARQILILEALGFARPIYVHIPLILAADRSKLSKRHGAVSIMEYKEMGYLPEAIVNYLALLGWNPGTEKEIFSMDELIGEFSLGKVQKGGAVFNSEKLDWINKKHLGKLTNEEFVDIAREHIPENLKNFPNFDLLLASIRERINKTSDIDKLAEDGEFDFYIDEPEMNPEKIVWKDEGNSAAKENLKKVVSLLERVDDFSYEGVKSAVQPFADERGRGSVMHPMRIALTGRDKSPDPFTIAGILGKEQTIIRLNRAIELL